MNEWLRNFRLGVVDILGITVPGILLILFSVGGFLLPLTCLVVSTTQLLAQRDVHMGARTLQAIWDSSWVFVLLLGIILAYILGYILRLASPNKLDKESARHVLAEMDPEELKHWPIHDVEKDKFPYLNFRHYLEYRGHKDMLSLVPWEPGLQGEMRKSSTHIQMMKLAVMLNAPELAALLESKEAHIRLLSGTWGAINSTHRLVRAGVAISLLGLCIACFCGDHATILPALFGACFFVSGALLMIMRWSGTTIERLFHYQRVRELFLIVASAYQAGQISKATAQNEHSQPRTP